MKTLVERPDIGHVFYLDRKKADGLLNEVERLLQQYERLTEVPMQVGPLKIRSTPKKDDSK